MARSLASQTWEKGFAAPTSENPAWADRKKYVDERGQHSHYQPHEPADALTSIEGNQYGTSSIHTWPGLYNGTSSPAIMPDWWKPEPEVDVLICGAGPFGLEVAMNLARQDIKFRIIDRSETPCHTGRADGLHPRGMEYLQHWGVGHEASEEGPLLNSTVFMRNGEKLYHGPSSMCDSRYKGIHIITQGQLEKIFVRDLTRHKVLVERLTTVESFSVGDTSSSQYPVSTTIRNVQTGETEQVRAKYLIGGDGSSSVIRQKLDIPFDGLATDCYWAIMDCQFKTDYPHILGFSIISSTEHGGCIIIPREDGHTRIYTQIKGDKAEQIANRRKMARDGHEIVNRNGIGHGNGHANGNGHNGDGYKNGHSNGSTNGSSTSHSGIGQTQVFDHGITPEEVLEQLNKIMAPWTVEFASPMSWFAVWRVNERVARYYSSPDQRVFIGGDAAHVHSVLGAFGLNSSIYDAANLSWKLGLSIHGAAKKDILLPTYEDERRMFANRVIRASGAYLRFICDKKDLPLAQLRGLDGDELESHAEPFPALDGTTEADTAFLNSFFAANAMFLLGVEGPIVPSAICPPSPEGKAWERPCGVINGARAPSPRVCFHEDYTAYLYDGLAVDRLNKFHIVIFASDLQGPVHEKVVHMYQHGIASPDGFYCRFGGAARFDIVLVVKALPHEASGLLADDALRGLRDVTTLVYDDRAPDEDAHYCYAVNHARGCAVVVRPDLVVGTSVWPEDTDGLFEYFSGFLVENAL